MSEALPSAASLFIHDPFRLKALHLVPSGEHTKNICRFLKEIASGIDETAQAASYIPEGNAIAPKEGTNKDFKNLVTLYPQDANLHLRNLKDANAHVQ